ncbi:TPA: hypothetical protein JG946_003741 [Enterobacter hormaechei subsp. steigerwaltii]|nr:hypothetical protein [Enterobacter hormaechei subsp. steigerwaltii]
MAGKPQKTDNSPFLNIAGSFSKYSDLTTDGKDIVGAVIDKCAGKNGYPRDKIYYVLYKCTEISKARVKYWLDYYAGTHKGESLPTDDTVRKIYTITKQLSQAFVEAHQRGVVLFKKAKPGEYYLTPVQKYTLDQMHNNGMSAQEMIQALQKMIDDAK